jgi:hypothetical protein
VIVDAGGGTVDLSAYFMSLTPSSFEEIAPAECGSDKSTFYYSNNKVFVLRSITRFGIREPACTRIPGWFAS